MQKCVLVITDGIGINNDSFYNAFFHAKKDNYDFLNKNAKFCKLKTSGLAVGLPDGQMGNSEVGHMCIGSGRVIYQNLVKIDNAIKNKELENNKNLQSLLKRCKNIHLIGLYSNGGVHSSYLHLQALEKIVLQNNNKLFTHLISDGRDVGQKDFLDFISKNPPLAKISSIAGRFWAMDRDKNYDRINEYINMLFSKNTNKLSFNEYIKNNYENNVFDEFLKPFSSEFDGISSEDGVIIVNFRADRARQLAQSLKEKLGKNVLCMCEYDEKLELDVIFEKESLDNVLAEVLAKHNKTQFHTAETEKYAHVSFFFNGGVEKEFKNETRILVPSPKVESYNQEPCMSAFKVCDEVLNAINLDYDFIVVNFANGDMVGHTGDFNASIKAVECVDLCLGKIIKACKDKNYAMLLCSDHGNCEAMMDKNNNILTNHTTFDVGCWLYNYEKDVNLKDGSLANIAASILKIMQIPKPEQMQEALF